MAIREDILERVRRNQPAAIFRPKVPDFTRLAKADLIQTFAKSLDVMAGVFIDKPPGDFSAFLRKQFPNAKNICSAVPEYTGNSRPEDYPIWSDAAKIDVTIVRSPMGVAETGSVLLSDDELRVNTIALLAHDIVILLDPEKIVRNNIHVAYQHPKFKEKAYSFS